MVVVDNRRTFCEHCSLRADLPGFIGAGHAQDNVDRIKSEDFFTCHVVADPLHPSVPNRVCLGAALVGGAELSNAPAENNPPIYMGFEEYVGTQAAGRRTDEQLREGDLWCDNTGQSWYGWWAQALTKRWHYLMTTLTDNANDSVYLFFDQCEQLFGPLERKS